MSLDPARVGEMTGLPTLTRLCRNVIAERDLVTPCCGLVPFLRDFRLWCPGMPGDPCDRSYAKLAELVAVDEMRNAHTSGKT